jgi:hypothetical protein
MVRGIIALGFYRKYKILKILEVLRLKAAILCGVKTGI